MKSEEIKILDKIVTLSRLPLRGWARLEGIKRKLDEALEVKSIDTYFDGLVAFIEEVSHGSGVDWETVPWLEFLDVYNRAIVLNSPNLKFPMLEGASEGDKSLPWEYDGRSWYFWYNLFAKNYGWTEDVVGAMDIDDAIGLYQEILIDQQLDHEWEWGLTEIAYPYDSNTKKSKFSPLPRPNWMKPNVVPKVLPVVRMKASHLPMGNIVDVSNLT